MADNTPDVAATGGQDLSGQPIEKELAASVGDGRDITRPWLGAFLPAMTQDPVLLLRGGGDYKLYEQVLLDNQVQSTLQQRRLALTSREWEVSPGGDAPIDEEAAEWMQTQIDTLRWRSIVDKMHYGLYYGVAVAECMYGIDGRYVTLADIKVRNRRRFNFSMAGALRLKTMATLMGETMPPRKFWTFCTGADHDDEPYGLGLAHWLYWPVFFKRNGMKSWLIFLEKFGMPTAKGEYPAGATSDQKAALLNAASAIQRDSAIIVPQGMMLGLVEAARSGTADYKSLYDAMNEAITKTVLGQIMTSEAAGGQYKGDIQMDVRQDIVKADSDVLGESFTLGPGTWLTAWNFPGAKPPIVKCKVDEGEDQDKIAARYVDLSTIGFRPTLKKVQQDFGPEMTDLGMPAAKPPSPAPVADFDESGEGEDTIDTQADAAADSWQPIMEPFVQPIQDLIDSCADEREFLAKLPGVLHDMRAGPLVQKMAIATFKARGLGDGTATPV